MSIKRFDGANQVDASAIKRWNGSNWIDTETNMRWDGSNWVEFATKTLVFHVSRSIVGDITINILSDNAFSYSFSAHGYGSHIVCIRCILDELNLVDGNTFYAYSSDSYINNSHHGIWTTNGMSLENFYTAASASKAAYLENNREVGFSYQYGTQYVIQYGSHPMICVIEPSGVSTRNTVSGTLKVDYIKINGVKYKVKFVL